jgi:hypothetical protein
MLSSALALLSSLQIGLRIRESIERSLKLAALVAVAALLLIGASVFGLLAAYQALCSVHGYTPPEAAGIIAERSPCSACFCLRLAGAESRWRRALRFGERGRGYARSKRQQGDAAGGSRGDARHRVHRRRLISRRK